MLQLPEKFIETTRELLGQESYERLVGALQEEAPVSIRRNPLKPLSIPEAAERVPWCSEGYYLKSRPAFTFDPLLHAGCYYVQEASSMFIEQAFKQIDFSAGRVLDLCAAPGGKSTLWRSILPSEALLVCNEPIKARASVLAENMAKWGHPNTVVTNAYPQDFSALTGFFDIIATDVPCSGEGMFRKDAGAIDEWSVENVVTCADRQMQIIHDIWPALREGGYLIYSTCTYNRLENEENVARICHELGAEAVEIPTLTEWNITGDTAQQGLPVYHFFPHKTKGEGFFLALLRKTSTVVAASKNHKKNKAKDKPIPGVAALTKWLRDADKFTFFWFKENFVSAISKNIYPDFLLLNSQVHTISAGILLAEDKGKKMVPQQELALSVELSEKAFPRVEFSYEQAILYLRREGISLAADAPRGYIVATFQGHPLGFLNNLGNRANNLYPTEWRIRSSYTPEAATELTF